MLTSGCMAQAQDARQAAAALAEAVYPGRLEVIGASTRVGFDYGQRVVLGVRGDPVTRIRLSVDKDPSRCRVGTPCETRLDAVRAEVGVCSGRGSGPCRPDQRVRLTYDLSTGQVSNFELVAAR